MPQGDNVAQLLLAAGRLRGMGRNMPHGKKRDRVELMADLLDAVARWPRPLRVDQIQVAVMAGVIARNLNDGW